MFLEPVASSPQSMSPWRAAATPEVPKIINLGRRGDTMMCYVDAQRPCVDKMYVARGDYLL